VEDDAGDAFLVQELLADEPLAVDITWVRTLAEATAAMEQPPRCILLDLGLPDAEGLGALRYLIELAPQAAVLVLTGLADEHRGAAALAAGAQDYLVKDQIDGPLLARAIRYALERKRADENLRRLYQSELRQAENARLERGLLPLPLISDRTLSYVSRYRPGRHQALLGGDFYDAVETPDGTLCAMIGDVCGHGPDEAALGVSLRIAWRTLILAGHPPHHVLTTLDDVLVNERRSAEVFATVCQVTVSPQRRHARIQLAGHPSPICVDTEPKQLLTESSGPALGVVPEASWEATDVELAEDWTLMLFTDGLVEGRVGEGSERLGQEGLLKLIRTLVDAEDRPAFVDRLIDRVEELNGGVMVDDLALLVLRRNGAG